MSDTPAEQNWPVQPEREPERLRPPTLPAQLLRASDSDRDEVAQALGVAFSEGRLTLEEHDDRLSRAMQAKTLGELAPLTHDLQVAGTRPVPSAPGSMISGGPHRSQTMLAVFSGGEEKGSWSVPAQLNAVAVFGGHELDMRDATFEADVIDINVTAMFGGVNIVLPRGARVIKQTFAMFGGVSVKDLGEPDPGAPTIRLRGLALFGGVDVKGRGRNARPVERR